MNVKDTIYAGVKEALQSRIRDNYVDLNYIGPSQFDPDYQVNEWKKQKNGAWILDMNHCIICVGLKVNYDGSNTEIQELLKSATTIARRITCRHEFCLIGVKIATQEPITFFNECVRCMFTTGEVSKLKKKRHKMKIVNCWHTFKPHYMISNFCECIDCHLRVPSILTERCDNCGVDKSRINFTYGKHICILKLTFVCDCCEHKFSIQNGLWDSDKKQSVFKYKCKYCNIWCQLIGHIAKDSSISNPNGRHLSELCEGCIKWGNCHSFFLQPSTIGIVLEYKGFDQVWSKTGNGIQVHLDQKIYIEFEPFVQIISK